MNNDISRRTFGLLSLATAAATLPDLGHATSAAYANPHLLAEPDDLIRAVTSVADDSAAKSGMGLVVVDLRSRDDYDKGHIPGALHMDANAVVAGASPVSGALQSVADIENLLGNLGIRANRRLVFYDDRGGFHAARMLWLMEYLGHRNVAVLHGGWSAWVRRGGPVSPFPVAAPIATLYDAALSPRRHASADDILTFRDDPDTVLVDVRPPKVFAKGHIPWAINIPWSKNLRKNKRFLSAPDLMAHFESHGVTPEHNVIMHCEVGLASSHSYVALRLLGFPRLRVYHRSWAEWGNDPDLPAAVS